MTERGFESLAGACGLGVNVGAKRASFPLAPLPLKPHASRTTHFIAGPGHFRGATGVKARRRYTWVFPQLKRPAHCC